MPTPSAVETVEDYAERVLFSTDLADKLRQTPQAQVDFRAVARRSHATTSGTLPGRPDHLLFARKGGEKPALPSSARLINDKSRGTLLHFFANHELLACELMALALLRFPDAPTAFRRGLVNTMREEQEHTRLYLERMREGGTEFGEYPVNGYFWEAVSTMQNPTDYVSRLSLTFEQANLDYARFYGGLFSDAGDGKTASILHQIYEDEISHVGYGLHWFQKWKGQDTPLWDALDQQLTMPLSPARAKGTRAPFNREGRTRAGFPTAYVDRLEQFERSRGRTPNVFYFNPEAEHRIAQHPQAFHPKKALRSLIHDLETLTAFIARPDDVALVRRRPSLEHLAHCRSHGLAMPEFEEIPSGRVEVGQLLTKRKIHQLHPWAVAPDLPQVFAPLCRAFKNEKTRVKAAEWRPAWAKLFSKTEQHRSLAQWMGEGASLDDREAFCSTLHRWADEKGTSRIILKNPHSIAGGGHTVIPIDEALELAAQPAKTEKVREWLAEPFHDRVFDFSVQFEIQADGRIRKVGYVEQLIGASGRYEGSLISPKFCKGMDSELAQFLMQTALPLYEQEGQLSGALAAWAQEAGYSGPIGLDSYVHRCEQDGSLKHRAICEVNPRYTMGRVAIGAAKQVAPGSTALFEILPVAEVGSSSSPVTMKDGRIDSGQLLLTEVRADTRWAARLTISRQGRQHLLGGR